MAIGAAISSKIHARAGSRNQKRSRMSAKHHLVAAAPARVNRFARPESLARSRNLRYYLRAVLQPKVHLHAVSEKDRARDHRSPLPLAIAWRNATKPDRFRPHPQVADPIHR